jgi:hypothetical protein
MQSWITVGTILVFSVLLTDADAVADAVLEPSYFIKHEELQWFWPLDPLDMCIDVQGAPGDSNGASLQLWQCERSGKGPGNSPTDQRWFIDEQGFIKNGWSGKCVDVIGEPGESTGSELQLSDCEFSGKSPNNAQTDQKWFLDAGGVIRNKYSNKCIGIQTYPVNNGSLLELRECAIGGGQMGDCRQGHQEYLVREMH